MQSAPHPEDDKLVQALISDDQEAWNYFISKHCGLLRHILKNSGIPEYDLDDCMGELFYKLISTIENYNSNKASLKTWLHTVAHNFALDWLKSKDFKERQGLVSIEANEEQHSGYTETHIRRSSQSGPTVDPRRKSIVRILKKNFKERQVKLIFLKHYEDLSWEEISKALVSSDYPTIDAAKMDATRIAKKLKILLQEYDN